MFREDEKKGHASEGISLEIVALTGFSRPGSADWGTWVARPQIRLYLLPFLAVEGSAAFHRNEFNNGNTEITAKTGDFNSWQVTLGIGFGF